MTQREFETEASLAGPFAFSPGADHLLAGTSNGEVRLWDLTSNALTFRQPLNGQPYALAFSRDGRHMAFADDIELYTVEVSSMDLKRFKGHGAIWTLDFSPDGRTVATGGGRRSIRLWRVGRSVTHLGRHKEFGTRLVFSSNELLACGGFDGSVLLWNFRSGNQMRLVGGATSIMDIEISRDGSSVVAGSRDGTIHIWDVSTREHRVWTRHTGTLRDLALSPDGTLLASAADDKTIRVWSFPEGRLEHQLRHRNPVWEIAFTASHEIVSADSSGSLSSWDLTTAQRTPIGAQRGTLGWIEFSSTGSAVTSDTKRGTVLLWTRKQPSPTRPFQKLSGDLTLALSSEDDVAVGTTDGLVLFRRGDSAQTVSIRDVFSISRMAISPKRNLVAAATNRGTVNLWEPGTGRRTVYQVSTAPVQDMKFSPLGDKLAVASGDGAIVLVPLVFDWTSPSPGQLANWASFYDGSQHPPTSIPSSNLTQGATYEQ